MDANRPAMWKILLAFGIIYFVWGSTFLGIRVGVREIPPFLMAGMRFFVAGLVLYGWTRLQKAPRATAREWIAASAISVLIFGVDYGCLFWAEQRVPSGIAAVMLAIIPLCMALSEILLLRTQRMTPRLAVALLIGLGGVAVLVSHSLNLGEQPIDRGGALALVVASLSWSIASALMRKLPLPASKMVSSGAQMLTGGLFLFLAAAIAGEFHGFHVQAISGKAWFALAYLIVAGSIVGFTAYVWLLHHESPTRVGTYAYVNPVVAVAIGHFLGGELIGARTLLGSLLVLVSVIVITTMPAKKPGPIRLEQASQAAD